MILSQTSVVSGQDVRSVVPQAYTPTVGLVVPAGDPVYFDGTNDYLTRGAALSGIISSKVVAFSVWFRSVATTAPAANQRIIAGATGDFRIQIVNTTGYLQIIGRNAATTNILNVSVPVAVHDGVWHNFCGSIDLNNVANRWIAKDDVVVASPTWATYVNDTMDVASETNWSVGGATTGTEKFYGDMCDLWLKFGVFVTNTVANRRNWITETGKLPANTNLADTAFGAPIVGMRGPVTTWRNNIGGTGGAFTENGILTDGTKPVAAIVGP